MPPVHVEDEGEPTTGSCCLDYSDMHSAGLSIPEGCSYNCPFRTWNGQSESGDVLSQDGMGFGSAIEAGVAGAVRNGDWRRNRLGDPETKEELILRLGGGARCDIRMWVGK